MTVVDFRARLRTQFRVKPTSWSREVLAGLSGAIGSVPDGMAAAALAGVNPVAGLFASMAGPFFGGFLTSTPVIVIATTSAASVTTSDALGSATDRAGALALLTILTGVFILVATALGIGRLMRFVSASVMTGFMFGVALILILSQIGEATGVKATGSSAALKAWDALRQLPQMSTWSIAIAVMTFAITLVLTRIRRTRSFAPLVAIVVATLASTVLTTRFHVTMTTVGSLGDIESGLPKITLPNLSMISTDIVTSAAALTLVILVQAYGVSSTYRVGPQTSASVNQDFFSHSAANVASGLLGGIPIGASVGQTALNKLAGGQTRWAVIISGAWMLVFVAGLGPLLLLVPMPALAALLILAGINSLKPRELLNVFRTSTSAIIASLTTLIGALVLPIQAAVLLGVLLSLVLVGVGLESGVSVSVLKATRDGRRERTAQRASLSSRMVTVVSVRGNTTFTSVPKVIEKLPRPSKKVRSAALVLHFGGSISRNQTLIQALNSYQSELALNECLLVVCGIPSKTAVGLQSAGLTDSIVIVPQTRIMGESLDAAEQYAVEWIRGQ